MKSPKQTALEKRILRALSGKALKVAHLLIIDREVQLLQDYANTVSIKRLNYNDHGPVHMRKVTLNALRMLDLLNESGVRFSLETEEIGTFEDCQIAVLLAAFLHDVGMSVGRHGHEHSALVLAMPIIDRILSAVYDIDMGKTVIVRSLALEGIAGHMGTQRIHSLEAGAILVADGCDMERGRARIPLMITTESKVGDIHKYSSSAIRKVDITAGKRRPIRITVEMSESVGFFQVEEVLMTKIDASPLKSQIELYAGVIGQKDRRYL